jgi:hypothetical protein
MLRLFLAGFNGTVSHTDSSDIIPNSEQRMSLLPLGPWSSD